MAPVSLIVIGAGQRGAGYARWARRHPDRATGNRELISSGPRESLASHLAVFAAERARLNGTVETI